MIGSLTQTYYSLAAVNSLLFCVGATQVTSVLRYQQSLKQDSAGKEIKDAAKDTEKKLEGAAKEAGETAKSEL